MLDLIIAGFIAANECDSLECQRIGDKLGFKYYDFFNKPQLAKLAEDIGFEWRGVDDRLWRNRRGGVCLTAEEIAQEIVEVRQLKEKS